MTTTLGQKIKEARKSAGLTQVDFVERIGLTQPALSQIEGDQVIPNRSTLILMGLELGSDFGLEWLREHLSLDSESGEGKDRKDARLFDDVATILAKADPTYNGRDKITTREALHLIHKRLLRHDPGIMERVNGNAMRRASKHARRAQ